jgi:hypothetical protein
MDTLPSGLATILADMESPLPFHQFVDPDRGKRRGASLGGGVVTIDSQLLSNGERPLAMLGGS